MCNRLCLAMILCILLPLTACADGCIWGRGLSQFRETHQLAVIHLTESTADVSMFIAIDGIPAGEQVTYILPFWYQPQDFTLKEDLARAFRDSLVTPAHEMVKRMAAINAHSASDELLHDAPIFIAGPFGLILNATFGKSRPARLLPYATDATPHARAELYHLGNGDLQQLIQQSGLPARSLQALAKYRTPYFAVMHLTGLTRAETITGKVSGRGIRYHFTHHIAGRYVYPLGTGAAWPQPIPITEVYITCPERLAMQVSAPIEGEQQGRYISGQADSLMDYLNETPDERKKDERFSGAMLGSQNDIQRLLSPEAGSFLSYHIEDAQCPCAWHIAYLMSNPAEDIRVQLFKRPTSAWRLRFAELFASPGRPFIACCILYLLCWVATIMLVIRRRWLRAGSPGKLFRHGLSAFLMAQIWVPFILVAGGLDWLISSAIPNAGVLSTMGRVEGIFGSLLAMGLATWLLVVILKYERKIRDWRSGVTVVSWLYTTLFFAILAGLLYELLVWCETV